MARSTKPPSAFRMKLAVHMRRCGSTWRAVGFELGCSPETVRQWPRVYPQEWQAAVREDAKQSGRKASGEMVSSLRMMLRDGRHTIRVRSGRLLIQHRLDLGRAELMTKRAEKGRSGWLETVLTILRGCNHDELKSIGDWCLYVSSERCWSPQPVWSYSI